MSKLNLPWGEWLTIAEHAAYVAAGAGLTYLSQNLTGADYGPWTPVIVALLSVATAYSKKLISTNNQPQG